MERTSDASWDKPPAPSPRASEPASRALGFVAVVVTAVALIALAAYAGARALGAWAVPLVGSSYGVANLPYELFAWGIAMGALVAAAVACRRWGLRSPVEVAPVLGFLTVFLHAVYQLAEYAFVKSWDYGCYERAAQALLRGGDPYAGTGYLYPPLTARLLAALAQAVGRLDAALPRSAGVAPDPWAGAFYFAQCGQLLLVAGLFALLLAWARRRGVPLFEAAVVVTFALALSNPLVRTLRHHQVNLFVLVAMLVVLLHAERRPWLAGLLLAVAAHVKLYPALLLLPWLLRRRWRPVVAFAVGAAGIAWWSGPQLSTWAGLGRVLGVVQAAGAPEGVAVEYLRSNTIPGFLQNTARLLCWLAGRPLDTLRPAVAVLARGALALVVLGFALRAWRRERGAGAAQADDAERLVGHQVDCFALMLLLTPLAWEHVFVFALPVLVEAWARSGRGDGALPWPVIAAWAAIFVVPTVDLYPVSYSRLLGLGLLVELTSERPTWGRRWALAGARPDAQRRAQSE